MAKLYLKQKIFIGLTSLALLGIVVILPKSAKPILSNTVISSITDTIDCRVLKVKDGDTFEALIFDSLKITVRLSCIDAPELRQQFGNVSKSFLAVYLQQPKIRLFSESVVIDRYGRVISEVHTAEGFVNLLMVEQGMAFVYYQYCKDDRFNDAEQLAYSNGLGVHSITMLRPWEFRHQK